MKKIFFIITFFTTIISAQQYNITGSIKDKESRKPLSYANVRIDGTTKGTTSNFEGIFVLNLSSGSYKLIFSYVGYKKDTLSVIIPKTKNLNVFLQPEAIKLQEVIVNANEDPAYRIIREAIKRKRENRKGLINFEYDAYSKRIIKSAGEVAVIEESFIKGYNKINDWEKEYVLSTHKTENQKEQLTDANFVISQKYYIDFSRDTLSIIMNKVYLPLADNAFDYYDYKLLDVKGTGGHEIYRIKVIPRSNIQPLLQGEITIDNGMYALNSVDLEINKGVRFPYVNNLKVRFVQQLGKYKGYWLPDYVETKSGFEFNFQGIIGLERMEFDELSSINNYKINDVIPDSVLKKTDIKIAGISIDTSKTKRKPVELTRDEIEKMRPIPLTSTEDTAYANLDSTKTLEKMIKFKGALSGVAERARDANDTTKSQSWYMTGLNFISKHMTLGNNRVSGLFVGPRYKLELIKKKLSAEISGAYEFGRKKWQGTLQLNYSSGGTSLKADVYYKPKAWQNTTPYPELANGLAVTLGFDDQFNYYLAKGFSIAFEKDFEYHINTKITFTSEKQTSMHELKYQGIIKTNRNPRVNYNIVEGTDNNLNAKFVLGSDPTNIQPIPMDGLKVQMQISNPIFASDFNYKSFIFTGKVKTSTFYKELFIAPYLELTVNAGYITGSYGPQHLFSPGTALGFFSPPGMLKGVNPYTFAGNGMVLIQAEHNWRSVPFQALGLDFISDLFLDAITGVSVSKTWNDSKYSIAPKQQKPYWEVYAGISRILGLFRVDASYNSYKSFTVTASLGIIL